MIDGICSDYDYARDCFLGLLSLYSGASVVFRRIVRSTNANIIIIIIHAESSDIFPSDHQSLAREIAALHYIDILAVCKHIDRSICTLHITGVMSCCGLHKPENSPNFMGNESMGIFAVVAVIANTAFQVLADDRNVNTISYGMHIFV